MSKNQNDATTIGVLPAFRNLIAAIKDAWKSSKTN